MTFLALLELMRMGAVRATQEEGHGRIVIEMTVADATQVSIESIDEYDSTAVVGGGEDGRSQ